MRGTSGFSWVSSKALHKVLVHERPLSSVGSWVRQFQGDSTPYPPKVNPPTEIAGLILRAYESLTPLHKAGYYTLISEGGTLGEEG